MVQSYFQMGSNTHCQWPFKCEGEKLKLYFQPKMLAIFLWAFASGIPILLISATLSARLLQSGFSLVEIGIFSTVVLPYSLKFLAGPFVEKHSIPFLSAFVGHARAWVIVAMTGMMLSLIWIANIDLNKHYGLYEMLIAAYCTTICSSISDIAEAKLRVMILKPNELAFGTACYSNGFGLGEIIASGGALFIAGLYGWQTAYLIVACLIIIGPLTIIFTKFPTHQESILNTTPKNSNINLGIIEPFKRLLNLPGGLWILLIIISYYASSYLSTMVINPFYMELGFTITQIGALKGAFGIGLLILGSMISGILCERFGVTRILMACALSYMINNLLQSAMATLIFYNIIESQGSIAYFLFAFNIFFTCVIDGISVVAYLTLILSLSYQSFTITQNAFLSSLMGGSRILFYFLGTYLANYFGWSSFFALCALIIIPVLFFILKIYKVNLSPTEINRAPYVYN